MFLVNSVIFMCKNAPFVGVRAIVVRFNCLKCVRQSEIGVLVAAMIRCAFSLFKISVYTDRTPAFLVISWFVCYPEHPNYAINKSKYHALSRLSYVFIDLRCMRRYVRPVVSFAVLALTMQALTRFYIIRSDYD